MRKYNESSFSGTCKRQDFKYIILFRVTSGVKKSISKRELYSWYMVTDLVDDESDVRVNRKLELVSVDAEKSGNAMVGIAYILEEESRRTSEPDKRNV